jgi:hypothetical protein
MTRLDLLPPLPGRHAVAVAAAVAQWLADRHADGLPHGAVGPDQVWVGADGAVRLADPVAPDDRSGADDIAALGGLLRWLADRAPDARARRLPLVAPVPPVDVLRDLAHRCGRADGLRPTAAEAASELRARVPDASFPAFDAAAPPVRWRRRRGVVLGSAAAVALAGAVALPPRCAHRQATAERPARPGWADGVLVLHGRRYAVGAPGDDVVIGRWRCAHVPVVVLLRAATGDIVRFDRLPVDDTPLAGRVVARIPSARRLVPGRDARGCATLAVVHVDGRTVPLPTAGTP